MDNLDELKDSLPTPKYRLSGILSAHEDDVRSLSFDSTSRLFSASRDGTARSWVHSGPTEGTQGGWELETTFGEEYHSGFVNSIAFLPRSTGGSHDYVLTGGQDALIQVFPLSDPPSDDLAPSQTLAGHSANVCCLHSTADGLKIVSGSWDFTARIWTKKGKEKEAEWETEFVLEGHEAAVWDVLALEIDGYRDSALTACADGLIRLFKNGERKVLFKGHSQPVRALAKILPEERDGILFASASNDETIRIWNLTGDQITILDGHDSYIYSIVSIPSLSGGGLASSGEDGIVKIWNPEDGEEEQVILVPALSVWCLAAMPNGDLAIGCSDNLIWVFTRDDKRGADEETVQEYEEWLEKRPKPGAAKHTIKGVDVSELEKHGKKEGEIKIVEVEGKTHAYQWTKSAWVDVGEVVGGESAADGAAPATGANAISKMVHDGVEYDYVFSIDVKDDEPPLKLPYNLGDDTTEVAEAFVKEHSLPETYTEQIVGFIVHNSRAAKR